MWFTQISLKNPVLATMMMLVLVVLGVVSLQRLPVDQYPDVDYPYVVVVTGYPGASPAVVETEVSRKIEEAVNTVAGIRALTSNSYEGLSQVMISFVLGVDGDKATNDIRDKVAQIRSSLRDEVKDPIVQRYSPDSLPIWSVVVTPKAASKGATAKSATEITDWADQVLKKRLENVPGVGAVNLVGAARREIHINLIPAQLDAYGISANQVLAAVQTENQSFPLGNVRASNRDLVVEITGRMTRPEDFGRIIVARRGSLDGSGPVYLDQVAKVEDSQEELDSLALYDSQRAVLVTVQKTQKENTIQVVDDLNKVIRTIAPELPPGLELNVVFDGSQTIRVTVQKVYESLIEGAVLTVLIVFLFLNSWRSTVITGLTLPVSIIGTFFFMQLQGFTIDLITLMALALCVGFLIDDAIVVRENIVRHLQMGKSAYVAALDGTREIGLAVLATTSSIVAVFLSVGSMRGILGQFFHPFGLTVVAAVVISMFVSFTLDPMLSSVWHDPAIHAPNQPDGPLSFYDRTLGRIARTFERAVERFGQLYQIILRWGLRHRFATVAVAVAIFVVSVLILPFLGSDFIPNADFSESNLSFYTPTGTSLEATEDKARQVVEIIRSYPETRYALTTINSDTAIGKNSVKVYIRLVDRNQRKLDVNTFSAELRRRLMAVPGITVTQVGLLAQVSDYKAIGFSLEGPDQGELERIAGPLLKRFAAIPGLVDPDTNMREENPTIEVTMNRDAASSLGLSLAQVAGPLRTLIAGETAGNWRAPNGQTYDVIVRLTPEARNSPHDLQYLPLAVAGPDGQPHTVRLNQVASLNQGSQINQINRRSMQRQILFTADTYGRSSGEVANDISAIMEQTPLPPGYQYEFVGTTRDMRESFTYGKQALIMAVIFIYMVLASQFRSFVQPLALMTSLPMTLIGVVLALLSFGTALSMFSIIGIVTLMGLVTKNAILLVDFANRARAGQFDEAGQVITPPLPRDEALLMAAQVRLRPILMTTLAMIFGMMPLAFSISEGAEQRAPLGQSVIGGVITSSLLTLVVVPVVYSYLDDLTNWVRRVFWSRHAAGSGNPPMPPEAGR